MRRQFVSNVAFYSTTAVLILIIVLCIGATVKSESRDETQRMENRIQEQQLMSDMKQYLNENGYRNSGVTLTYALEEDGSPDYTFTIHHKKINSMSETERGALSAEAPARPWTLRPHHAMRTAQDPASSLRKSPSLNPDISIHHSAYCVPPYSFAENPMRPRLSHVLF